MNPKIIENLIDKLKLTPIQSVWCMSLSEKHALWIGNQIKLNPEIFPKEAGNIKKILLWKKKNIGLDINEYDFKKALAATTETDKTSFKKDRGSLKNQNIVAVCEGTEYKWVELKTAEDVDEEGKYMRNCLRGAGMGIFNNNTRLFSLRNDFNKPVATIRISGEEIVEFRGRFNHNTEEKHNECVNVLDAQAKVKINPFSKFQFRIIKTMPPVEKNFEGNLIVTMKVELPEGLCVNGNLEIRSSEILNLPYGLVVKGNLKLSLIGRNVNVVLPSDMKIEGDVEVFNCQVVLPEGLNVRKNLILNSQYVGVPKNLVVEGNLVLARFNGKPVPSETKIKGDLLLGRYVTHYISPVGTCSLKGFDIGGDILLTNTL